MTRQRQLLLASLLAGGLLLGALCCGGVGLAAWYIGNSLTKSSLAGRWERIDNASYFQEFGKDGSYHNVTFDGTYEILDSSHYRIKVGGIMVDQEYRIKDDVLELRERDGLVTKYRRVKR